MTWSILSSRFLLTAGFYLFHHAVFTLTTRTLLARRDESYFTVPVLIASLVNATIAIGIVPLVGSLPKTLLKPSNSRGRGVSDTMRTMLHTLAASATVDDG